MKKEDYLGQEILNQINGLGNPAPVFAPHAVCQELVQTA